MQCHAAALGVLPRAAHCLRCHSDRAAPWYSPPVDVQRVESEGLVDKLTDVQRAALRWIVRAVRAGWLGESFSVSWVRVQGREHGLVPQYAGDEAQIPPLTEGMFAALVAEGYLLMTQRPGVRLTRTYTLRRAAYDAVDAEDGG